MSAGAGGEVKSRHVRSTSGCVRSQTHDGHVAVVIEGSLDHDTAGALLHTVAHELESQPTRVDIDLSRVTAFADLGAQALGRCRDLCASVPAGLHFRTEGGAGQTALLAAFESEPVTELE
jgi:hypothetical protein